jgi:hypothetical protein
LFGKLPLASENVLHYWKLRELQASVRKAHSRNKVLLAGLRQIIPVANKKEDGLHVSQLLQRVLQAAV